MTICEVEYCDFVCWMPHGMHIEHTLPDTLFSNIKPALELSLLSFLPTLITGRTQQEQTQGYPHLSEEDDTYCW